MNIEMFRWRTMDRWIKSSTVHPMIFEGIFRTTSITSTTNMITESIQLVGIHFARSTYWKIPVGSFFWEGIISGQICLEVRIRQILTLPRATIELMFQGVSEPPYHSSVQWDCHVYHGTVSVPWEFSTDKSSCFTLMWFKQVPVSDQLRKLSFYSEKINWCQREISFIITVSVDNVWPGDGLSVKGVMEGSSLFTCRGVGEKWSWNMSCYLLAWLQDRNLFIPKEGSENETKKIKG